MHKSPVSHASAQPQHRQSREIIVDVRTPAEFALAHVPGAKNIPVQELQRRHHELGPKDTPLVLYCRSGARSAIAAVELRRLGYRHITDIGPMSNWPSRA